MKTNPRRIDVHHHFQPPEFIAELGRRGIAWTGGPAIPEWSVPMAHEVMGRNGIDAAVASVVPSVHWDELGDAPKWARHSNEFLARAVHDEPLRFGGFATLPLPDTGAACRELDYALGTLGLDGVILFTSYGRQYLGDPDFDELFQELDRRSAIVFIHPSTFPPGADVPKLTIPYGLTEFVFDTTRTIASLLYGGTFERYPNVRFIVSHAGGTVPYITWRLALGHQFPALDKGMPKGALHYLRRLYFDTALSTADTTFAALGELVPTSQVLFGSDWPLVPETLVKMETEGLEQSKVLDDAARAAIDRGNALKLFPRFAGKA